MATGSVAAAAGLIVCALAPVGGLFVPALVAVEITSTLVQYGAAFPLLVQRHPETGQRSIVYLTLIAGFASTIFWPITTALHAVLSWQEVYFIFAVMHVAICLPIHLWLSRPTRPSAFNDESTAPITPRTPIEGSLSPAQRQKGFVLMASGFALQSFIGSAILVHMLPVLTALGLGLAGVMVGSLFGPAQVLSRFLNMVFGKGLSQLTLAMISAGLLPLSVSILLAAPSVSGALVFAVLFGMGHGLYSIVSGTLPLALFGSAGYGARQGQITAVRLVVGSVAPFALALLIEKAGINWTLAITAALGAGAVLMFYGIIPLLRRAAVS